MSLTALVLHRFDGALACVGMRVTVLHSQSGLAILFPESENCNLHLGGDTVLYLVRPPATQHGYQE